MIKVFCIYLICCFNLINTQGGFVRQAAGATARTAFKTGNIVGDVVYRAPKKALSALSHPQRTAREVKNFVMSPKKTFNAMKDSYQVSKNISVYAENAPLNTVKNKFLHNKTTTGSAMGDIGMPLIRIGDSLGNVYKSVRSALSPRYAAQRELKKISGINLNKNSEREQHINTRSLEAKKIAKEQQFKKDFPDSNIDQISNYPTYNNKINRDFELKQLYPDNILVLQNPKNYYKSLKETNIDGEYIARNLDAEKSAALSAAKDTNWYTRLLNRDALKKNIKNAIQKTQMKDTPENVPF